MARRKRFVLAIDGGGIRGLVPLRLLETLDARLRMAGKDAPLHRFFDLMAGTSSGGLIAAGLAAPRPEDTSGRSAYDIAELRRFFETECRELFQRRGFLERLVANPRAPFDFCFDERPFEKLLKERFGWSSLQGALTRLLLPAYDIDRREPLLLTNGMATDGGRPADFYMWQAVRATMALPGHLPPMRTESLSGEPDRCLIGGSLFLENPVLAAYAMARRQGWEAADMVIVSLGSGARQAPRKVAEEAKKFDALGWLAPARGAPLLAAVSQGQAASTAALADDILRDAGVAAVYRFDADLPEGVEAIDNARPANIIELNGAADRIIRDHTLAIDELAGLMSPRQD
ncbi:patatin-like phospholipase family protein [Stappia sp.]|uniref:patatin-like phospholipase family protein n=1 Tax=Stappia sp. TaxID=1870903 RepID=UPI003A998263